MGVQQPGKAPGPSIQQIERQLHTVLNDALKVLDTSIPANLANQAEIDNLRSLIWSELTGLEAELGREDGPRADRVERFFQHLLSSGKYIGQIETLGSALLGDKPLSSQQATEGPVAALHQVHSSLASLRKQWQQAAEAAPSQPAGPARPSVPMQPPPSNDHAKQRSFGESAQALPGSRERSDELEGRDQRLSTLRAQPQQAREPDGMEWLFNDLSFGEFSPPVSKSEPTPPQPRAIITFVAVLVVLALFGVGVIYVGLSGDVQSGTGAGLVSTQTITFPTVVGGTPSPSPTLNPAPPQLLVQGANLQVPCAKSKQGTGFVLQNVGGQILSWNAEVNGGERDPPVSLSASSGQLYGGSITNTVVVTVTALIDTSVTGTITVSSNAGAQAIQFHVLGC